MTTSGSVRNLVPLVPIVIVSADSSLQQFHVLLDTGFDGYLTLSASEVRRLGLENPTPEPVTLADGAQQDSNVYTATVIWLGERRLIRVHELGPRPLVGMALLHGNRVTLDVIEGGPVTIGPLGGTA